LKTRELPFNFELLKGGEINAFAVPGGFVFINSSLIEFCEYDRDKIAFVLAHEIAHIVKGHAVERVLTEAAASSAIKAGKISGALGAWIRKAGFKFLQTGYSRYQETEADTFAVQLMQAAGFQSGKAIEFLQNLEDSKGQRDGWDISKYFSTHPEFKARIETIRKNLKQFE
jgi:predicted Zn-dependent protease